MWVSATANFVGSAVLGTIGVATLKEVKHRRELLFAAMPCLFAVHQFTEGFVWLGVDQRLPSIVTQVNSRDLSSYMHKACCRFSCR